MSNSFKQEIVIAFGFTAIFCGILFAFLIGRFLITSYSPLKLAPGELAVGEVEVTIPEGFSLAQIEQRLISSGVLIAPDSLVNNDVGSELEGYLFPDTYRFYRTTTSSEVIERMRSNFDSKVGPIAPKDLILASIVQKEVTSFRDMATVAGIFRKRLSASMPLQADSTVNYITGKNLTRVSLRDTRIDSPYNTYKYKGLPPGPISNPGLDAIRAAQNPISSPYWYFLTTPEGQTIYSRNFEEHKVARIRYLQASR